MAQFQQQIGASLDDTLCRSDFNNPTNASAYFGRLGTGKTARNYDSFLRFLLDIPKGETITSAILTLYSYSQRTDDFISQINFTNEDDAADFTNNPWARTDGGTNVTWTVPDFPAQGSTINTVDISSLIQTFIDRAGYNANNHIAIRIKFGDATDNEYQVFYQWDGNNSYGAILTVEYGIPAGEIKKISGKDWANVKKVAGEPVADIKKIAGEPTS